MATKVSIIGAGQIGQALATILKSNSEVEIELWDKESGKVPNQKPVSEIIPGSQFVFMCVPSWVMRIAIGEVKQYIKPETIIISVAKGLEEKTLATIDQVLTEELGNNTFALMGGPLIAEELLRGQRGVGMIASAALDTRNTVAELFKSTTLLAETSDDARGVALASVLKNIYAVGLGAAAVLLPGLNIRGWYVSRACEEMGNIIERLGGKKETAYGAAGIGDLIATGFSSESSNHQAGRELAETGKPQHQSEGVISLPQLVELLSGDIKEYPLLQTLQCSVINQENISDAFQKLLAA